MIRVEMVDKAGRIVPRADTMLHFAVSGAGRLIGVGNGNPNSLEADQGSSRRSYNGLCQAIVQVGPEAGLIRFEARADGLRTASVALLAS